MRTMADRGLEKTDIGALSPEQQEKLRQFKIRTRIANEMYLRDHPEVEMMLSELLRNVFIERPTDIRKFAAGTAEPDRIKVGPFVYAAQRDILEKACNALCCAYDHCSDPDLPRRIQMKLNEKSSAKS